MIIKKVASFFLILFSFSAVSIIPDEKIWQETVDSLASYGISTRVIHLDTSLIDQYTNTLTHLLEQPVLSLADKDQIEKIALLMTAGPVYRDGSVISRWNNYARISAICTLSKYVQGMAILQVIAADNPQLQNDIEVLS